MDKLYAIQDVFVSVQSALDEVASHGERIKKWVPQGSRPQGSRPLLAGSWLYTQSRAAMFVSTTASRFSFASAPLPPQHLQLDSAFPELGGDHRLVSGHTPPLPHSSSVPRARVG